MLIYLYLQMGETFLLINLNPTKTWAQTQTVIYNDQLVNGHFRCTCAFLSELRQESVTLVEKLVIYTPLPIVSYKKSNTSFSTRQQTTQGLL
jgi:hypothetical protein